MSERVLERASRESDPLFNLLSLKIKCLTTDQVCDKCQQPNSKWTIISICHHLICEVCAEEMCPNETEPNPITRCPECNVIYNSDNQATTVCKLNDIYTKIEKHVYNILALEKGTLEGVQEEPKRKMKYYEKVRDLIIPSNYNGQQDTGNDAGPSTSNTSSDIILQKEHENSNIFSNLLGETSKSCLIENSAEESVKTGIEKVESRKENNVKFKSSNANDVTLKDIGESSKHLSSQTKGESNTLDLESDRIGTNELSKEKDVESKSLSNTNIIESDINGVKTIKSSNIKNKIKSSSNAKIKEKFKDINASSKAKRKSFKHSSQQFKDKSYLAAINSVMSVVEEIDLPTDEDLVLESSSNIEFKDKHIIKDVSSKSIDRHSKSLSNQSDKIDTKKTKEPNKQKQLKSSNIEIKDKNNDSHAKPKKRGRPCKSSSQSKNMLDSIAIQSDEKKELHPKKNKKVESSNTQINDLTSKDKEKSSKPPSNDITTKSNSIAIQSDEKKEPHPKKNKKVESSNTQINDLTSKDKEKSSKPPSNDITTKSNSIVIERDTIGIDLIDPSNKKDNSPKNQVKLNNSKTIHSMEDNQSQELISVKQNSLPKNCSENSSDGNSESEEDVIKGTPERSLNTSQLESYDKHKKSEVIILHTGFDSDDDDLSYIYNMLELFENVDLELSWTDNVTHLILKTDNKGRLCRTKKYFWGILSNCYIVNLEWVKKCIDTKCLQHELEYMPLEMSGERSPLTSWQAGQGIIKSPLEWTKDCALYMCDSVKLKVSCSDLTGWAIKAGFILVNKMEKFLDTNCKIRIVLIDQDNNASKPDEEDVLSWIHDYKAVAVYLDWFLECLARYRFIEIGSKFQVIKLSQNTIKLTGINESLFDIQ